MQTVRNWRVIFSTDKLEELDRYLDVLEEKAREPMKIGWRSQESSLGVSTQVLGRACMHVGVPVGGNAARSLVRQESLSQTVCCCAQSRVSSDE